MTLLKGYLEEHFVIDIHHVGLLGAALRPRCRYWQFRSEHLIDSLSVRAGRPLCDLPCSGRGLRQMILARLRETLAPAQGYLPNINERRQDLRRQLGQRQILADGTFAESSESTYISLCLADTGSQPHCKH